MSVFGAVLVLVAFEFTAIVSICMMCPCKVYVSSHHQDLPASSPERGGCFRRCNLTLSKRVIACLLLGLGSTIDGTIWYRSEIHSANLLKIARSDGPNDHAACTFPHAEAAHE